MKIAQNNIPSMMSEAYLNNVGKKSTANSKVARTGNHGPTTDRVVLSDQAKELQMARKMLASVPDVRSEKIAGLKEQLRNGTYRADPQQIASGMIRESLVNELLSRSSG